MATNEVAASHSFESDSGEQVRIFYKLIFKGDFFGCIKEAFLCFVLILYNERPQK